MGNFGAEKAKNQGFGWQQGCVLGGGVHWRKHLRKNGKHVEKWGKMGENGGWGEIFCDLCGKIWKTWCVTPQKINFV